MGPIVDIISRCGLTTRHKKHDKSKLPLYKPLLHFYNHLKQLYICNKTEHFIIKVGVAYVGICILRRLKQELAWATDKWIRIIAI